ncbi:tetratricopeptide repeat protein [Polyangium fumosum]|uniref:Tetratricopeptide repeat protein n=1 Tax=Polyangium fumosum TaxID=889272 RepID=A0A4U1IXX3_9BACT|nr:tetratricopeptide repeat protein [Polyangium fumosum]TKC99382.1 tetratricopeptide repeat protein [Polyangium fumosum]
MSVEKIRVALGVLQSDPENEAAWNDLAEAVTAPDTSTNDVERLLGLARAKQEERKEWGAVAKLLELEISFAGGTPVEPPMQAELARIYNEELVDADKARAAYERLLELRPNDDAAAEALESDATKRERWSEIVDRYVAESENADGPAFKSSLLASAADVALRYGHAEARDRIDELIGLALALDPKNSRATRLLERASVKVADWDGVTRALSFTLREGASKEDRIAAGLRLGRVAAEKLGDKGRARDAFAQVLDLQPGQADALAFLAEHFTSNEQWDELVALYEDQLKGGGVKPGEELGVLVQIGMVHWRMRGQPQAAEAYFDRVRRADPTHAGMLAFFREHLLAKGDKARLYAILTDAQRALPDGADKRAIASELAKLAESTENAHKAIDQYKNILRTDPDNRDARDALKRLYMQTEGYNALVELYRQELERTPQTDVQGRIQVLRDIASVYRDRAKNDAALVTVLTQIAQLDERDIDAVRELTRVYETLGRWRDLLSYQQRLAELSTSDAEKANLYRAVARRWVDQFSNVQNAVSAYESLLAVAPGDDEAESRLKELYLKRRSWAQLYALYEAQLPRTEDAARIELLGEMAKLAAERLDRGADAIAHYKQILELDASAPGVLDALEKQAERDKDFATVAEVLERRVDAATDDAGRLNALQKLGAVYAERLKDPVAAARTWRRVLVLSPGHARALRVLRESYVASGDWDGLEELYASQNDWEGLVEFLSGAADKTTEPNVKLDISFRAARIYEEQLGAPERAVRSYERVLSVSPTDARAAAALVPIYEKEEKWARLPALYEILLGATSDVEEQVSMLRKLAAVTGGPLADKQKALGYARRAYELDASEDGLSLLEAWSRAASSWGPFVEAVEARLKRDEEIDGATRRALKLRLAEVYARELGKVDEAAATYRELVEADPTDEETIRELDALLRANEKKDDLRWLFQLRADQVEGEARAEILEEWATLEEEVFGDNAQAILLLRKVVEVTPARGEALRALSRLLIAAGEAAAGAEVVARHRDVSDGEQRGRCEVELATLYLEKLERPVDAFDAAVRALEILPHEADAVSILARLLDKPETRAQAAQVLSSEYAETGDARREAHALRVLLETETDTSTRLALFLKLADVNEEKLRAVGTALDVVLGALNEFSSELTVWDRASELAARAGRPTDLAEAYRTHLVAARNVESDKKLPDDVEIELCERAAMLHDDQLGDPEGAMPYLDRVLAVDPTNERAFSRLKQILTNAERWSELEALYDKAAQGTPDQTTRISLLNDVAVIAEEIMSDAAKAIRYYERILTLDAFYEPALDALQRLYEREGRWKDLAALLERRLETSTDEEAADIKLSLGRIYLDRLHEPALSLEHLERVLEQRPGDAEARQLVERLLEVGSLRLRAARVLEVVYEARDEVRQLVRVLEIRREGATEEHERRELLRRVSTLRDDRLRDDPGAFATLSELVPLEPDDAIVRERFVDIGRRLAEHEKMATVLTAAADACSTPPTQGEILMVVAQICADMLGDLDRAEKVYRRVLSIDETDPNLVIPAAQALAEIYTGKGKHEALAEVLGIEVRLEEDLERRQNLYRRIGEVYESVLEAPDKAIGAWRARMSDDPEDLEALSALERLYERTGEWRELVSILEARQTLSNDANERKRTMVRAAETLASKLDDVSGAISGWRNVSDEFGPEPATLSALEALYEKAERWSDLADTLDVHLSLANELEERLDLFARLGDVRRLHQSDLPGALDAYRQALVLDPANARCRNALEALLEDPEARRDAAETLHPLYEADGDSEKLLRVLEIEVETADSTGERLSNLQSALRTAEGPLTDTGRAFGYAVRGVREAAGEPEVAQWIETVERLAKATGRWAELSELYRSVVDSILDGDVQQDVRLRVGELARTKLDDKALAVEWYKNALDARSDDRRAMVALEELYGEANDAPNLLEILRQRVDNAADDVEKKRLLFRQAELQRDALKDPSGAIETYEALLDVELNPKAIDALETLYKESTRWEDLIKLYERQLDGAVGAPAELRVKIAKVAHERLEDVSRAFDELAEALVIDAAHVGAVGELEALLEASENPAHRARAGEMLEPVYLRRADWARVKMALDARLTASEDPSERRDLLTRLATLHEEQLEDYKAALETVAKLLHEDLGDEGVWHELERLAKVASAERRLAEIYSAELTEITVDDGQSAKLCRRTGEIYADLNDVTSALKWYRRAHEFEPESRELFSAIDGLLVRERRHEERVELYRSSLDYRYDKERLDALHTIARLERIELKQPEKSIETYRAALDVDESDARALDALTELYAELGRDQDLADLYLRRAEAAANGEAGAPYRLALARLLRDKIKDTSSAIDQLEAIVTDVPWHQEAIKELEALTRDEEHKARVVEILRPLYERSDDWRLLVKLNEERYHLASEVHEKVAVLRETAQLWETRGNDRSLAFRSMRAAFALDPEDGETRAELERLATMLGAWERLSESYEQGIEKTTDDVVKRELLLAVAKVYDEKVDDPRRALGAYRRLSELDPTERDPLEAIDMLSMLLSDWQTLIAVLEKKSELASDDENAAIWRRIAETKLQMLDDEEGAIKAYERALELDPESTVTVDALIPLYEPRDAAQRLVELYARRVELAGSGEADLRYDLNVRAAERYEKSLDNRREAINALNAALDARPSDATVLASLERLYRAEKMWDELLDNLKLQASTADTRETRVKLRTAIGDLYAAELASPQDALEHYRLVLDDDATNDHAIKAIRAIGEGREELRLDAADALEPVLRAASRWEELVGVLEMRLKAQTEGIDRARTLRAIAIVEDEKLGKPLAAEGALLRALEDTPDDPELHAEIERLAERSEGFGRYCDALSQRAAATFDAVIAKDLWLRVGRIAEDKLKDDRRSVEAYAKAVEQAGDEPALLEALDRLYSRLGDNKALADVLERRVAAISDEREQANFHHRLATIQIEAFGEKSQGLATLKQALERAPDHAPSREALEKLTDERSLFEEAAEALESVYKSQGDHAALAKLYEKRIGFVGTPAERVRLRLDLAKVLEDRSGDPKAAQGALEAALKDDPADVDVLAELERLSPITGGWASAADALEKAVSEKSDLSTDAARDLWMRIAEWRKDKLADNAAAERALEQALKHDPTSETILRNIEGLQRAAGRERDLVGTLRRLAALDGLGHLASDLRREAKGLAEGVLADDALTEAILRDMIKADDSDAWALAELTKVRDKAGDSKEVFDLLVRQAELAAEGEKIRELKHRAALVAREKLSDDKKALDLYSQIFEDEPNDAKASDALRELYAKGGKHKELLNVLSRLVDLAETPASRATLRLESARICIEKLDATSEAMEHLRAILDEERTHEQATLLLSQLLEKSGRDDELAELLNTQIDLAKERGDLSAELVYSVRLGEVFENRLNNVPKAIETYKAVLERDGNHKGALLSLARLYEKKGDKAEAAKALETVLSSATGEEAVKTSLRLADLYTALKDEAAVRRVLEAGLKADERAADIRKKLHALYEKQQAWAELADLVKGDANAATEAGQKVQLYRKAADIHLGKRSDPGAAADLLVKASELAPGDRELLLVLCDAYSASGRGKQAAEVLQKIVESYGGRRSKELATIHHRLAKAYLAEGDKEKALADLDIAFKIDPGSIAILRDLGVLSMELGEATEEKAARDAHFERAQKTFRALLLQKLDENSPISKAAAFYYIGRILHAQGDDKKAIQQLDRAIDADKNFAPAKELLAKLKK